MKPSIFQQAIYTFVEKGTGNAVIQAKAGSGKTTTIKEASKLIPRTKRTLFLAFNVGIKDELLAALPKHIVTQTINSLGHQAWMRHVAKVRLDTSKTYSILKSISGDYDANQFERIVSNIRKMVSVAKANGLAPQGFHCLLEDTTDSWNYLIDHYDILFNGDDDGGNVEKDMQLAIEISSRVLKMSVAMKDVIDFDDQIYMTVLYKIAIPKYDVIFVDEAQDVSKIQVILISMAMAKYTRLIAVGDSGQAIYGFRGADSESLNNIAKQFNATSLPLSISYRCPKAVIKIAQQYVADILPSEDAPEGTVEELGVYKTDMFKMNDFVICRNTAPVVKLAYKLIADKIPAKVEGKDLAEGLINLIKRLNPKSILQLNEKLLNWKDQECKRLKQADPEADVSGIEDKYEVIQVFMESSAASSVPALLTAIDELFGDEVKDCVRLSTIHKAKGLEAERVFILDGWLMPSRYAVKPWQIEQEKNLAYVAVTRSKSYLAYIESPSKRKRSKSSQQDQ